MYRDRGAFWRGWVLGCLAAAGAMVANAIWSAVQPTDALAACLVLGALGVAGTRR